jgi:hypothetical protein
MPTSHSTRTRILYAVLGLLALNALLGIVVILVGSVSHTGGKAIGTSFLLAGGCLLGLAGSTVIGRAAVLAGATILGSALGVLLVGYLIWVDPDSGTVARAMGVVGCLTVYGAFASLLVSRARPGDPSQVRGAQVLALAGLGVVAVMGALFCSGLSDTSGGSLQLVGAALILGILGLLAAPILRRTADRPEAPTARELDTTRLDELVGLRVVAVNGAAHDVLVFEDGTRVRSHA